MLRHRGWEMGISSLSRQVPLLQHEADERVIPHQPTSHVTSGHSLDAPSMSPLSPSYLVVLITSKRGKLISAGTLANSGGLLCCFNLLKVVVASDFGNYQHQRLLIPSLLFWSIPCYLWSSPLHLWSLPCYLWSSPLHLWTSPTCTNGRGKLL